MEGRTAPRSHRRLDVLEPESGCILEMRRPRFRWRLEPLPGPEPEPEGRGRTPAGKGPRPEGKGPRPERLVFHVRVVPLEPGENGLDALERKRASLDVPDLRSRVLPYPEDGASLEPATGYVWRVTARNGRGEVVAESDPAVFYVQPAHLPFRLGDIVGCCHALVKDDLPEWETAYGSPELDPDAESCLDGTGAYTLRGDEAGGDCITRLLPQGAGIRAGRRYGVSFCARVHPRELKYVRFRVLAHDGSLPSTGAHPQPSASVAVVGETSRITSTGWIRYVMPPWLPGRDYGSVAILAISDDGRTAVGDVGSVCVREVHGCGPRVDATVAGDGSVRLPEEWNEVVADGTRPEATPVSYEAGAPLDMYGQPFDALGNHTWYGEDPCVSVGGTVPPAAEEALDDRAGTDLGGGTGPDDVATSVEVLSDGLVTDLDDTSPYTGKKPPPCEPFRPDDALPFGGRDVIYVHGLRPVHIAQLIALEDPTGVLEPLVEAEYGPLNPEAAARWPADAPEFFPGGFYHDEAESYWGSHIDRHLGDVKQPSNRYLVVGFNSSQRLPANVSAVLTQIARAMATGDGVRHADDDPRGVDCFGERCVIISHSTGALVTDVALSFAGLTGTSPFARSLFGDLSHIPERVDSHVALHGAIAGSELASLAVVGANGLGAATGHADAVVDAWLPVLTTAAQAAEWLAQGVGGFSTNPTAFLDFVDAAANDLATLADAALPVINGSILVDLMPPVTVGVWGWLIGNTPVPTLTVAGGHPSALRFAKPLLPGYDDGVVSTGSQSASPNLLRPDRFFAAPPEARVLDEGIDVARAIPYFVEQTSPSPGTAYGSLPFLSPTGMLQPVLGAPSPEPRFENHFTFLQSASDHGNPIGLDPAYETTPPAANYEETLVVDDPRVFQQGLVDDDILSRVRRCVRGEDLVLTIHIFFPVITLWPPSIGIQTLTIQVVIPLWRRRYDLLLTGPCAGAENDLQECDYVYEYVLR